MYYLEITAAPVPRVDNPVTSPAAELAMRLENPSETVELRFHRQGGATRCYLGLPNRLAVCQAKSLLRDSGFLQREQNPPTATNVKLLLHRAVEQRPLVRPGKTPVQMLLPTPITADSRRCGAMLRMLSERKDGCGFVFYFRKASGMPLSLATHLHQLNPQEGSVCYDLLHSVCLFEAVGGIYGADEDVELLAGEALCSYCGMKPLRITSAPANEALFRRLQESLPMTGAIKALCSLYLDRELSVLADVTASAGLHGLPLNRDTIFGMVRMQKKPQGQTLQLGYTDAGEPVQIPLKLLRQHMFIGGAPNSGKGNQFFSMAMQLHKAGIPMLLIESAKEEMHHLAKVIDGLQVWQPKEGEYVLNPFALEGDITVGELRTSMLQAMRVCFKLDGPLEELFSKALNRCFIKNGFSDNSTISSPGVTPFGLSEFMEEYSLLLEEMGYSERTKQDMKTGGNVRLDKLFNQNRGVFDTVASVPITQLLSGKNLIQLNCLTSVEAKQMFASLLLISVSAFLRLRGKHCADRPLKLAIILDESHNLLQPVENVQGQSYSFAKDFANMLLELRSQGVALIIADQSANNIPGEITDVCATKVFMGSSVSNGIQENLRFLRADETALNHLYLLGSGEGIYVTPDMPTGAFFTTPNLIDHFGLEQDYPKKNAYLARNPRLTRETFHECSRCPASGSCSLQDKTAARQVAGSLNLQYGPSLSKLLAAKKTPERDKMVMGLLAKILTDLYPQPKLRRYCAAVQFLREFNRENPGMLSLKDMLENGEKVWKLQKSKENHGK